METLETFVQSVLERTMTDSEWIDSELERLYNMPRQRKVPLYPWNTEKAYYQTFLDWTLYLSEKNLTDYRQMNREKLVNSLQDWLNVLFQAWYFNNRHAIANVVPMSIKHISAILLQLWRTQRRGFAKKDKKPGQYDAQALKGKISAYDFYSKYGHLEKNGGDRYKTICPWHNDDNPSLTIYEDGHCWCFSCNHGGDYYNFLVQVEKCTFRESVEILAKMVGG